jgi:hypothetical protein
MFTLYCVTIIAKKSQLEENNFSLIERLNFNLLMIRKIFLLISSSTELND